MTKHINIYSIYSQNRQFLSFSERIECLDCLYRVGINVMKYGSDLHILNSKTSRVLNELFTIISCILKELFSL